jgi:hypothetical protein
MKPQYIHIDTDGTKTYYKDKKMTKIHREDGPAVEISCGSKYWVRDGVSHREDGPAIIWADSSESYYLDGYHLTKAEYTRKQAKVVELTLQDIADLAGVDVSKIKIVK